LAIKCIDLEREGVDLGRALREVRLAASVRSSHLTPLLAAFGAGAELWLVQPRALCSVRDLLDGRYPGGLPDDVAAAAIVAAVAGGLAALHAAGVAHRDVKAANVLLFEGEDGGRGVLARLTDLGTAGVGRATGSVTGDDAGSRAGRGRALALGASLWRAVSGRRASWGGSRAGEADPPKPAAPPAPRQPPHVHAIASPFAGGAGPAAPSASGQPTAPPPCRRKDAALALPSYATFAGSPAWMAPEVFNAAPGASPAEACFYSQAADVFSTACLLLELAHGLPPGADAPLPVLAMSRLHGPPPDLTDRPDWPPAVGELVRACGAREPGDRPTAREVCERTWVKAGAEPAGAAALAALVRGGEGRAPAAAAHPASSRQAAGGRALQSTLSEAVLKPYTARAGPPRRALAPPTPRVRAGDDDAAGRAAALLDAPVAEAILRAALLPGGVAGGALPTVAALEAALAGGSTPLPASVAGLGTATAVALFGRDHSAGRALGKFHYRLGAAFLRVPVPPGTQSLSAGSAPDPTADAAYEADPAGAEAATAWAGPVLFFLGRRRPDPSAADASGGPLVLAVRTAHGARALAAALACTATGGRALADVLPPRAVPTPGADRGLWIWPAGAPAAWPATAAWDDALASRGAGAAWVHAAADLTAAAHGPRSRSGGAPRCGGRGGGSGSSAPVSPSDVLAGRVPPPRAWGGVVGLLAGVRGLAEDAAERVV